MITVLVLAGCRKDAPGDLYGGGTVTVSFAEGGPLVEPVTADGATAECLPDLDCTEPKLSLQATEDGDLDYWVVNGRFDLEPELVVSDCFGGVPLRLQVLVVGYTDHVEASFNIEDPAANDPNADQGGATSPELHAFGHVDEVWEPLLADTRTLTWTETEISGRQECEVGYTSITAEISWEFDEAVHFGPGELAPAG